MVTGIVGLILKIARSKDWAKVRKLHLAGNPYCAVCYSKRKLEVHHIVPVHIAPELELEPSNLITLCSSKKWLNCHLLVGHLGSFKSYNIDVVRDAQVIRDRLSRRP